MREVWGPAQAEELRQGLLAAGRRFELLEVSQAALDQCALENWFFNIRREGKAGLTPLELGLQWRLASGKNFVGAKAVPIPLRESSEFGFDLELFEKSISPRTKLIIINSPANPTGGVLDRGQIDRIAAIAAARNVPVMSDEIYRQFLYDGEFVSIYNRPGMAERTIILDGFSKSYAICETG